MPTVDQEHAYHGTNVVSSDLHSFWMRTELDRTEAVLHRGGESAGWNAVTWTESSRALRTANPYEIDVRQTSVFLSWKAINYKDMPTEPKTYLVWESGFGKLLLEMVGELSLALPPQRPSARKLLAQLREWTGLTMAQMADTLGVSRRTLYSWIATGRLSPQNETRLAELIDALEPLAEHWRPSVVRSWLFSGSPIRRDLIRGGRLQELATDVEESLASTEIPLLQARVYEESKGIEGGEVSLSGEDRVVAFREFAIPRAARVETRWQPPEISDSGYSDDR